MRQNKQRLALKRQINDPIHNWSAKLTEGYGHELITLTDGKSVMFQSPRKVVPHAGWLCFVKLKGFDRAPFANTLKGSPFPRSCDFYQGGCDNNVVTVLLKNPHISLSYVAQTSPEN